MPLDQSRIQGFGSDGSKEKTWRCPKNHLLQPWKANAGRCDGCNKRVQKDDMVMDCRQCNYYLCDECHPQQREKEDWFWGSVSYFMEQASQEVSEIAAEFQEMAGEFETFVSDMALTSSCGIVETAQFKKDELQFESKMSANNKKPRKVDSQKRSRSTKRSVPEADQKKKQAEQEAAASGAEADEEGGEELLKNGPATPQAAATSKGAQSKCFAKATKEAKAEAEAPAPAAPEVAAPPAPPPMEDLLDMGQNDLLDLDLEPAAFAKKEEHLTAVAAAKGGSKGTVAAIAAQEDLLDLDLDFSEGKKPVSTDTEVDLLPDLFK